MHRCIVNLWKALRPALAFAVLSAPAGSAQSPVASEASEGLSGPAWSALRDAYDAARHAAAPVPEGYRAANPGQRWRTLFDGRGSTTRPDAGGWTWGLELERYGFAGHERAVAGRAEVSVDGSRVHYDWDAALREWYVNDARGLEHGFTVRERPARGSGRLAFHIAVRGGLQPVAQRDGLGVDFVDGGGAKVLTYSGLTVFDADGATLPARLEATSGGLLLSVDERGARYPVTIDPLAQQAYLKASNTDAGDEFGRMVAVDGDTAVVGAWAEDSNATGVGGNEADNSAADAGAVYVFVRSGTTWSQQAYLKASNTDAGDAFGWSVDVSGDTVVVGAHLEDSSATGVGGNQSDNSATDSGAAYVFTRSGTTWSQQAYLKASNTQTDDEFGYAVSVSNDTVVVGARGEDSSATGINGSQGNGASFAGAAYVFTRSGTTWSQQAYVKASNTDPGDIFGTAISIDGDTMAIGAQQEKSSATGVGGDESDNSAPLAGATYVFTRSGTTWSQQAYVKASNTDANDKFGFSVGLDDDTLVVGAIFEESSATGVGGNESDNSFIAAGAAYVFTRSGTTWSQQAYLKASNTDIGDRFGLSAAVDGDTVVVSANTEDGGATGVGGEDNDNTSGDSGAVYAFVRLGTTWAQQAYVKASNTGQGDWFGYSVSMSGDTLLVGAIREDSNATGVNGDETDNSAGNSGAAYVLEKICSQIVPSAEVVRLGTPPNPNALLPGQTNGPVVGVVWDPVIDHTTFYPQSVLDILIISGIAVNIPTASGTLLCDVSTPPIRITSGPGVPFIIPIPPSCTLPGAMLCSQGVSLDGVGGSALTNALDITFGTF